MSQEVGALREVLSKYESAAGPISESSISEAIRSLKKKGEMPSPPQEWLAELMAFEFCPEYENREGGWGLYFGPMMIWKNKDGTVTESPSITRVTPEIVTYWAERVKQVNNPVLKARYADLVWDFSKKIKGDAPHFSIARIVIESIIEISHKNCHEYQTDVISKLKRALSLALAINDSQRVEKVKEAVIAFENMISEDDKPGLWGFTYDLLLENKKVSLTADQKNKIISDLEDRLKRTSNIESLNPWAAEHASIRLANYYRSIKQSNNIKRVLLKLGKAFEIKGKSSAALQLYAWLQHVHAIYLEYGLNEDAERLRIMLRELGPKITSEMKSIPFSAEIPRDKMDKYIEAMVAGDLNSALCRMVIHFIPKKNRIEKQLEDLSEKAPLSFLFGKGVHDTEGRLLATVGSLDDDLVGNVIQQISQNMAIESVFLRDVLEALIKKFNITKERLIDYIYKSPIFSEDKKEIIAQGFGALLVGDHLVAIHLLIPRIEDAIRILVENMGGSVLKPARAGGFHLKTLDELLRDTKVISVFGEDATLYFRVLLTDQRGWNIRNNVCHGISHLNEFGTEVSDRVLHIILCLAQVREQKNNDFDKKKVMKD